MLNHIDVMGRITREPELRYTQSGLPVVSFSIANDRDYAGEGKERQVDFIDCVAWRGTATFISKYFHKGDPILVSGRLQMRDWTDREGGKRRAFEVIASDVYFCGRKSAASENVKGAESQNTAFEGLDDDGESPFDLDDDEELPL